MNILSPENVLSIGVSGYVTTNTGIESRYYSMRNCEAVRVEVMLYQGLADATEVSIWQDKEVGFGSADAKALENAVPIYYDDQISYGNTGTPIRQTDGVLFAVNGANFGHTKHVIFYVRAAKLDCDNGFSHIGVKVSASGQAGNFGSIQLFFERQFKGADVEGAYI